MKKKVLKRYKNLKTNKWFTHDETDSVIIKYTPEECGDERLRNKRYDEVEKTFSDTEEDSGDDNTEATEK